MSDNPFPAHIEGLPVTTKRRVLRGWAGAEAVRSGFNWAEFGVRTGNSAKELLRALPPRRGKLHLFDSWEGLPEDWARGDLTTPKGHFACEPPTFSDPRAILHPGLFEDTLHGFRDAHPHDQVHLAHLDCDIYSSTATVLEALRTLFRRGTVLIFDDIFGYPSWREGQWRAWSEWIGDLPHTWIGRTNGHKRGRDATIAAVVRLDGSWD